MLEHLLRFNVVRMAKVFEVSRSGFYYWIKHRHKAIQREAIRQQFDTKVKEAFDNSKGRDGSRRIQKELAENGDNRNVKTIATSMMRQGLTLSLRIKSGREISPILPQVKAGCIWLSSLIFTQDK